MAFTQRFDHVGVAVRNAEAAASLYSGVLGGEFVASMEVPEEGFRFAQYRYPNKMKVELLEPIADGGFVARFLERRGEGVHHLTFRVTDIERRLEHLAGMGIEPVHVVLGGRWKGGFIHPRQANGVLIQLLEIPRATVGHGYKPRLHRLLLALLQRDEVALPTTHEDLAGARDLGSSRESVRGFG